ncbi:MAG: hypothetical protein ABW321_09730, partial [Polyangiales bacterium]
VYDDETGKDLVVQDGAWIAMFGTHGTVGFVCYFAVMLWPIVAAARGMRRIREKPDRVLIAGLGFMVVVCGVNMLPNMHLPNLQFFFAAALATLVRELPRQAALAARQAKLESDRPPSAATGLRPAGGAI